MNWINPLQHQNALTLKFLFPEDASGLAMVFATLTGGIVWLGAFLFFMGIPLGWEKVTGNLWISMLYLSLGSTIITLFLYQKAIVVLGPKKAMAYIYLSPAIVAIGSYFFYGTSINLGIIFGILLASIATFWILKMPAEKL